MRRLLSWACGGGAAGRAQESGREEVQGPSQRAPRNAARSQCRRRRAGAYQGAGPLLKPWRASRPPITHNPPRRHHAHAYPTHSDSFCPPPAVACCRPTSSSAGPRLFVILSARSCPSRLPPARGSAGAPHHTLPATCPAPRTSNPPGMYYIYIPPRAPLFARMHAGAHIRRDEEGCMHGGCTMDGWQGGASAGGKALSRHATPRQRGRLARHFGFGFDARQAREVASLF